MRREGQESDIKPGKSVTLKDLARELGVNVSTVSRVLNDTSGEPSRWASNDTTERILSLARERGYSRNHTAASLRTAKSNMVGVIAPSLQDYVFATIYEGIGMAAAAADYFSIVSSSHDVEERRQHLSDRILEHRVAGFIFGDAHLGQTEFFEQFARTGVPYVLVSRRLERELSVTCDDHAGGRMAAEHLLATGRRTFGVLAGRQGASTARDRTEGFLQTLLEHGVPESAIKVEYVGFDAMAGRIATKRLIADGSVPEAIFATNDFAAIGSTGFLREQGIRVPEDVLMCGYNDTPLAVGVNLTSVRSPMLDMGRRSFELLMRLIGGEVGLSSEALQPSLVVRSSTGRSQSPS